MSSDPKRRLSLSLGLLVMVVSIGCFYAHDSRAEGTADDPSQADGPFQPSWAGSLGCSHVGEASQQVTNSLALNVTRNLTESGSHLFGELIVSSLKQEGKPSKTVGLNAGSGLGLGDLNATASIGGQVGNNRTQAFNTCLGLDYTLLDVLTFGLTGSVSPQSHEGTLASLLTGKITDKGNARLISRNTGWGFSCVYAGPWDWMSLAASAGRSWSKTLRIEGPNGRLKKDIDVTGHEDSAEFGPTFQIGMHWVVAGAWTVGKDVSPGAGYYNPRTGTTTTLGVPSTVWYRGFVMTLSYLF